MANPLKLWISPETGRILSSPASFTSAQAQTFFSGNDVDVELHLLYGVGVTSVPYEVSFPAGAAIQLAIGTVATAPVGGQWRLSVSSTETTDLAYNASASAVQTALNALTAVSTAGGVTVSALGGGYSITWNTVGAKPTILAGSDTLTPASYEAILILQAGDASTREIVFVELRQTPVALADTFSPISSPVVTATTVSAWNGTNKVVRVTVEPTPKSGSFTVTVSGKTAVVQAFATAADFAVALTAAGVTTSLGVYVSGQNQYDAVFSADETVTADGSGLITSPGVVGTLNLATSELIAYLGADASKQASIEVSVTAGGNTQTLVQVPCYVANGVLSTGAVAPISVGTMLTETVANARFVRKDIVDAPSVATQDILWQNIGVTLDGSDTVGAINNADSPAAGNPFATVGQLASQPSDTTKNWVGVWNSASGKFATTGDTNDGVLFEDQGLTWLGYFGSDISSDNTPAIKLSETSGVTYMEYRGDGVKFTDGTLQDTAFLPVNYLTATATAAAYLSQSNAASTYQTQSGMSSYLSKAGNLSGLASVSTARTNLGLGTMAVETATNYLTVAVASSTYLDISTASSTYAPLSDFDQGVKTTDSVTFNQVTFGDATSQNTRVVREQQANGSGFSTGGFDTAHYPYEVKVIDDTGTAYWVPARLA